MNERIKNIKQSRRELVAFFDWFEAEKPGWSKACERIQVSSVGSRCINQALSFLSVIASHDGLIPGNVYNDEGWTLENQPAKVRELALNLHDAFAKACEG